MHINFTFSLARLNCIFIIVENAYECVNHTSPPAQAFPSSFTTLSCSLLTPFTPLFLHIFSFTREPHVFSLPTSHITHLHTSLFSSFSSAFSTSHATCAHREGNKDWRKLTLLSLLHTLLLYISGTYYEIVRLREEVEWRHMLWVRERE